MLLSSVSSPALMSALATLRQRWCDNASASEANAGDDGRPLIVESMCCFVLWCCECLHAAQSCSTTPSVCRLHIFAGSGAAITLARPRAIGQRRLDQKECSARVRQSHTSKRASGGQAAVHGVCTGHSRVLCDARRHQLRRRTASCGGSDDIQGDSRGRRSLRAARAYSVVSRPNAQSPTVCQHRARAACGICGHSLTQSLS